MLNVLILIVDMQIAVMLSIIILIIVMLNVIMLSVYPKYHNAGRHCHYAECLSPQYSVDECLCRGAIVLSGTEERDIYRERT